jgi:glycosyltransferase involved in cell wall biosynthesis
MSRDKVLLIGGLNRKGLPLGGEEYKNRIIDNFLAQHFHLKTIDTHRWKLNIKVPIEIFIHVFFSNYKWIIISASSPSSYRLIQFLNFLPGKLSKTVYFVIGGYFPTGIIEGRYKKKYYKGLKAIVVEGHKLKATLDNIGLKTNTHVIPNFKPIPKGIFQSFERQAITRFVFLSSISDTKGVGVVIDAVKILLEENVTAFSIEFWGPIDPLFQHDFQDGLAQYSDVCAYKGYLDILNAPHKAYGILGTYDCLLFPTYYEGEGFPGVVLDAFIAGLPVIASDWNMNSEIISHGKTGLLIPPKDSDALASAIKKLLANPNMLEEMKRNSVKEAHKYDSNVVLTRFLNIINDAETSRKDIL